MYIITVKEDNRIVHISETVEYERNGNILINNRKLALARADEYNVHEVDEVPNNVETERYCYTEENGFYENENYKEYYSIEDRMTAAEAAINTILGF